MSRSRVTTDRLGLRTKSGVPWRPWSPIARYRNNPLVSTISALGPQDVVPARVYSCVIQICIP